MSDNRSLSRYTYMKTGGVADEIIEAKSETELVEAVKSCVARRQRYLILGGGSNTLFTDAGFRGTIILNRTSAISIDETNSTITADSGCPVNFLVNLATSKGLSGLEWFLGLPGTLGGAIYNNSHFKNYLIGNVIESVKVLNPKGEIYSLPKDELEFAYDTSRFHHSDEIILSAVIKLTPDNTGLIAAKAAENLKIRSTTQPLSLPSSGCIFQNPKSGPSAGSLIDQAGLKNVSIGDAVVSPIHANFIVNQGKATSADIQALAEKVESTVFQKFGVKLKKEVFFINEIGERI